MKNYEFIKIEIANQILTLTITRPAKRNALSKSLLQNLREILLRIQAQEFGVLHGLLLTGDGDRAFVAGADIQEMIQMTPDEGAQLGLLGQQVGNILESLPIPVVACVNGAALGGGCELALSCDFIYATQTASFGQPEVALGLIPGFGGCVRLVRSLGWAKAKELLFTGRRISAAMAKELHLVNEVYENPDEMRRAALQTLAEIKEKSPHGVFLCKQVLQASFAASAETAFRFENEAYRKSFAHADSQIGMTAFLAKEKPVWK
jgi:enoyl-CoA hydratase